MADLRNIVRELDKVVNVLAVAYNYHLARDTSNARLAMEQSVDYSPLTVEVGDALSSLIRLRNSINEEDLHG